MSEIDTKMQQNPYLITLDSGIDANVDLKTTQKKYVKKTGENIVHKVIGVYPDFVMLEYPDGQQKHLEKVTNYARPNVHGKEAGTLQKVTT